MKPFFKDGHWVLTGGEKLVNVHSELICKDEHCTIHNPSDHHMVNWSQHYREDRRMMERICPDHGIGHPDPDDPTTDTVHGCCGCCNPENKYKDLD